MPRSVSDVVAEVRPSTSRVVPLARVGIVCDMLEERWPSMDLVADLLSQRLRANHADDITGTLIRPTLRRRFSRTGTYAGKGFTADRLLGRLWDYPRQLRAGVASRFDVFHIVDHSHSHLVHSLPAARTIVTCHDLDTFRSILEPELEPRSAAFRAMARHILTGFRRAARVACDSVATRAEIEKFGLFSPDRLRVVPLGVDEVFSPEPNDKDDRAAAAFLGPDSPASPIVLHVGSTIARKRIDDLLGVFARVRSVRPGVRLIRVGGPLTASQRNFAERLGISGAITTLPVISRAVLAAVYRRASIVLQPSSSEGFGLPVLEAMACGTPVVASDLPALREVGGAVCEYGTVGDTAGWASLVLRLLDDRDCDATGWGNRKLSAAEHAAQFTWAAYARRMVDIYSDLRCANHQR